METISIALNRSVFGGPSEEIIVDIQIGIDRELSNTEERYISTVCSNIMDKLREGTVSNDPKTIQDAALERVSLISCFPTPLVYVRSIPNEYYETKMFPWLLVTTTKGHIKIGWRKRVIVIDWSDSDVKVKAKDLFQGEETTMDGTMIHAWGYDKAKEYLTKILS